MSASNSVVIYGIKNCDTMKKARSWLEAHDVAHAFHDYKTAGIDRERLEAWVRELGWEKVLNRAGTTFRKLSDADKADLDADKAVKLMLEQPSMIKRPVLDLGDQRILGFKPEIYETAFAS
ncbi:MAG: ArsC family reductase [Nitratireductor sp.]|uniref:ArsC family reductase n=1 Tax=Nitratireductor sp. TaxID=1872084 RepID=UPI0026203583|nr:ArsC family reductase [Nitratireductor sp.]MCV0349001.1 ArsC family reductase [Nitratireductor sp.]